jgi:hypothetical protein
VLELRNRAQYARHQPAGRGARVDAFTERHERDASRLPVVEEEDEMAKVSSESVEAPAHHSVELMAANGWVVSQYG